MISPVEDHISSPHSFKSLTLESQVRLFSFGLQSLDIWAVNDYSHCPVIKNNNNPSFFIEGHNTTSL